MKAGRRLAASLTIFGLGLPARPAPPPDHSPALIQVGEASGLPRILLIGDSISEGYTLPVRARLRGRANVQHPDENCRGTDLGLKHLDSWLGSGHWDVIHFNFGLHDLIVRNGARQVPLDRYEINLRELVRRLKITGAKLVFATTTPVPAGVMGRREGSERAYNDVARRVMEDNAVAIDDLWAVVRPRGKEIQNAADVHFTPKGYEVIAETVVASICAVLP